MFFFFNDTATTEIYTLSLHDALPICARHQLRQERDAARGGAARRDAGLRHRRGGGARHLPAHHLCRKRHPDGEIDRRSEEHTSELQSRQYLVCRLLLETNICM